MTQRPTPQELEEAKAWAEHMLGAEVLDAREDDPHLENLLGGIKALEAESAELTKALTGLTCGGSEFFVRRGKRYVADIDACVSWVLRTKQDAHRRALDAIKARQAAESEAAAWKADAATAHLKNQELRASLLEAVGALKDARAELEAFELEVTGEAYNNLRLNAAIDVLPPPPEHQAVGGE